MARPTKLTDELSAAFCAIVEEGTHLETAAESVGIAVSTLYNWLDWGSEGREPYAAFLEDVTRARAVAEIELIRTLKRGDGKGISFGQARAAAFLLERTRPNKYAQRVNLKVEDAVREVLEVVSRVCSPEDFARILERLERVDREGGEGIPPSDPEGQPATH